MSGPNTIEYQGWYAVTNVVTMPGSESFDIISGYNSAPKYFADEDDGDLSDGTTGDGTEFQFEFGFLADTADPTNIASVLYMAQREGGVLVSDFTDYFYYTNDNSLTPGSYTADTSSFSYPVCFLADTLISTPGGHCPIDSLKIGDLVSSASGEARRVKWIGRMTIPLNRFNRETATPICIQAGAFGGGLPRRDLFVSADHAFALDGLLVNAIVLVNGTTITRRTDFAGESIEYFQVELDTHDLILAEGAPAESFLEDGDNRAKFDNAATFHALYPEHVPAPPMPLRRVTQTRQLPTELKKWLSGPAAALRA